MKRLLNYIPFILFTLAIVSFMLPVAYLKDDDLTLSYNTIELIFGLNMQVVSPGLLIAFILLIISIIFSITVIKNPSNFRLSISVISGLSSGTLFFFSRMLADPPLTGFSVRIGLILPGLFIILATVLLFINTKMINTNKKDSVSD